MLPSGILLEAQYAMNEYTIDGILKREYKGFDNKEYWRVAKEIWKHVVEYGKTIEKAAKEEWAKEAEKQAKEANEKKRSGKQSLLTPEQRSEELAALLDEKLISRELTASDIRELKDIFNLKAKDQDIVIQMVDFEKAYSEEFDIIRAVSEQINRKN